MRVSKMIRLFGALGLVLAFQLRPVFGEDKNISPRDASADNLLIKNAGWMGALPPTGAPAAAVNPPRQASFVNPVFPKPGFLPQAVTKDRSDKAAQVYEVKGTAKFADKAGSSWNEVKRGQHIQEGMILLTQKASSVSVTLDSNYANVVFIPENTRAVFRKIEPTDIFLEDGTLYNFFDAVPKDGSWKVSSPVAVAAVRGTHYIVNFTAANSDFFTATFEVPEDGHDSLIRLIELKNGKEGGSVDVPEGRQIKLTAGQSPDPSLLKEIDPFWLKQIQEFLEHLTDLRLGSGANPLPPTGGEFFAPGTMDTAGADSVGGGPDDNRLDPLLDTQSFNNQDVDPSPSIPSQEQPPPTEGGGGEEPPPCGSECQ